MQMQMAMHEGSSKNSEHKRQASHASSRCCTFPRKRSLSMSWVRMARSMDEDDRRSRDNGRHLRVEPLPHFPQEALIVHVASAHRAIQHHACVRRVLQLLQIKDQDLRLPSRLPQEMNN